MKKYNKPELNIEDIEVTDIILTSGTGIFGANPDLNVFPEDIH